MRQDYCGFSSPENLTVSGYAHGLWKECRGLEEDKTAANTGP